MANHKRGKYDHSNDSHDWTAEEVQALFDLPFNDLIFKAQTIHREFFNPNEVQMCQLRPLNWRVPRRLRLLQPIGICGSRHWRYKLMEVEEVLNEARKAKEGGATRYCMGQHGAPRKTEILKSLKR